MRNRATVLKKKLSPALKENANALVIAAIMLKKCCKFLAETKRAVCDTHGILCTKKSIKTHQRPIFDYVYIENKL